ncbi:sorting nexin-31 [Xenopus laevis]|uniref:Sorting nexin-31 n=1 Tax=Xenopus laevis TaxID=8355 RepID=SNX31_XENLA|nr:sorting nexin-31 [Xenopus laevis]Q6DDY6.1 RecName: Full=Sorting nexin-31 [Xenopus laevis]AAH77365.1 MGC81468 protein [Xenopus laevis]
MHICIPVTEELQDTLGCRFVLYSVYLEGFLLFKVRYKDLHLWNEQIHRVFGNGLPKFPPKHYLAMTKNMANERRLQLEQYLQQIVTDPVVTSSDIFMDYFRKLQMDTFNMPTVKLILRVYVPDGAAVELDVRTSDSAERVLEAALFRLGVSRELAEYFSLFITHKEAKGPFTVVKRIAAFELPFLTIWNLEDDQFQIEVRKWYMNPSNDVMLMGSTEAIDILYLQAVQEFQMDWTRPTKDQEQKLQHCLKEENKLKFLELMKTVEYYGYLQIASCASDYPECDSEVNVWVGNNEMSCHFHSPGGHTEHLRLNIRDLICWNVSLLQPKKQEVMSPNHQHLEFKFEYQQGSSLKCITIRTEQAFLLSSCLKKMLSEYPVHRSKEELEIQVDRAQATHKFNIRPVQNGVHTKKQTLLKDKAEYCLIDDISDLNL